MSQQIKHVIILRRDERLQMFRFLTNACKHHGWAYPTMVVKKFPFERDGWEVTKETFTDEVK